MVSNIRVNCGFNDDVDGVWIRSSYKMEAAMSVNACNG